MRRNQQIVRADGLAAPGQRVADLAVVSAGVLVAGQDVEVEYAPQSFPRGRIVRQFLPKRCAWISMLARRLPLNSLAAWTARRDPDAEAAWNVEIERRVAAIGAGTVQVESWEDVRRRIEREILDR